MFENKRPIIAILALLLVGFGIEFIKGVDDISTRESKRLAGSDYANMDSRNFMRSDRSNDKSYAVDTSNKRGFKLSGVQPNMGEYDANGPEAKGKGKLKKKKKKKKKKKAKKKIKKKSSDYEVIVYEEAQRPESNNEEERSNNNDNYSPAPKAEDKETALYDEWAARLLIRPDRDETIAFIREYQSGKIDPDTFFRLINEMYLKKITEFRNLAVLAAGAAPSLKSYNFLVTAFTEDSNATVRADANTELRDYNVLQYLWVPRGVISAPTVQNIASATIAANAIDTASQSYLTPRARASADGEEPQAPQVESVFRTYFMALIPVLENAIQRYKENPEVSTPLTNALNRIQQLGVVALNEEL